MLIKKNNNWPKVNDKQIWYNKLYQIQTNGIPEKDAT